MSDRSHTVGLSVVVDNDRYTVQEALEGLVRRHHDELMRILVARTQNDQDAADLKQEAYSRLLKYGGRYTQEELRRMLFRIATNLMADHWRWNRIHETDTLADEHLSLPDEGPAQDRTVFSEQRLARLEEIIAAMPPKRRKVFLLNRVQGFSKEETALRCGISVRMVEKHVTLGIAECRAGMEQVRDSDPKPLYSIT